MSIASVLGGFAEAGVLLLVARIAFALASTGHDVTLSLGPLPSVTASVPALIVGAGVLVVVRVALQVAQSVLAARASVATVNAARKRMVHMYLNASWPLQSSEREGKLQELLTTYTGATSGAIGAFTQGTIALFNLVALLATALVVNAVASIGAAIAAVMIGVVLAPLRAALRRRSSRAATANLEFATGITEAASSLQEVRVFEVEGQVAGRLDRLIDRQTDRALATAYVNGAINVLYQGIAMALIVGGLGIAYSTGVSGLASLGAIVLIVVRSLGYAQSVQSSVQYMSEMAPLLETLRTEESRYVAAALDRGGDDIDHIGTLEFDDVSFEYEANQPVLRDVRFSTAPGEIIGIVGPSGAGKSTIVQLLLRLREPTAGSVRADGLDAAKISLTSWYDKVTFVPQEPRLFMGTVSDNVRFFRDGIDQSDIERACKQAHLHDDIVRWPNGYDTSVGERGGKLSGGQRQRLCIARALVEDPDIVVLDEVTAALDVRSESLIRDTIASLAPRSTVFVIAHRLSTLAICDRIMVVMNGAIEGFDDSATLEATNPFYKEALRLAGLR
jgi:ABC-type multidrug transport system fused ATPase/permease subunit